MKEVLGDDWRALLVSAKMFVHARDFASFVCALGAIIIIIESIYCPVGASPTPDIYIPYYW